MALGLNKIIIICHMPKGVGVMVLPKNRIKAWVLVKRKKNDILRTAIISFFF